MELLGNKFCVENLQKDVGDLHKIVGNLTSRLGQVNYTSWKFPDKIAMNVDVPEILEMCEFDADYDEENKISHLLLLEMVVDRLLFFIQCSNRFMDQNFFNARAPSAIDSNSSSIGVVTKKYWTKMLQLHSNCQQMQSDSKSQSKKIKELQAFNQELQSELSQYHQGVTQVPADSSAGPRYSNGSILPPITPSAGETSIAKDNSNKSSQTLETAFVPCESCHKVQNSFRSVADSMTNLCKQQGLPSAVAKYRKQLKGLDWYSANDIARWSVEQEKDLGRINKHLADLMATIDPMKEELAGTITSCRTLEQRVTECQREVDLEKETQRVLEKQHNNKMENTIKSHEEVKRDLESQRSQLQTSKQQLEQRLKETKCDLELQISKYEELDDVKKQLLVELEESKTNNSEVQRLETILSSLDQEMNKTKERLQETEIQLNQERAITKSLTKRTESLQAKYDSLVRRIDEMDDENCSLQSELSSLVEEKEQLENSLAEALKHKSNQSIIAKIESEKKELRDRVSSLTETIGNLEKELTSLKERETLMVEYPDLNGPVNTDMTGTGDIFTDMSNQVKANQIRIELLHKQNSGLEKTLNKMGNHRLNSLPLNQQHGATPPPSQFEGQPKEDPRPHYNSVSPMQPTPLWNLPEGGDSSYGVYQNERGARTTSDSNTENSQHPKYGTHAGTGDWEFTVGRSPEQQVPSKHTATGAQANSGLDAYMKLKKAGLLKPGGRQAKAERSGDKSGSTSKSFCCPNCDKLYHTLADLEIHRSYCARR